MERRGAAWGFLKIVIAGLPKRTQGRSACYARFPVPGGNVLFVTILKIMAGMNRQVLKQITGESGVLEIINSGSCFELPEQTMEDITEVITDKEIRRLFFESHWMYRKLVAGMRARMQVPLVFKVGVETFDYEFRQQVLNKNADFKEPQEVAEYFDSPCLMVGIKGQTKAMIAHDMDCLKKYFRLGTVNVYNNNTTGIRRDEELVRWFMAEYQWLLSDPAVEVLYEITDFGVG